MRFEPNRGFVKSRQFSSPILSRAMRRDGDLPIDIAFLRTYFVQEAPLRAAALRASREGLCAAQSLIAQGGVSEALFYRCLAIHLGVPFEGGWPHLAMPFDPVDAIARGRAKQSDGVWLVSPSADDLEALLHARRRYGRLPPSMMPFVITTQAHLAALVRHREQRRIAHVASDGLAEETPHLSAKGAFGLRSKAFLAFGALVLGLAALFDPVGLTTIVCLVFFAAMSFRLLVCAHGLGHKARVPPMIRDTDAPFYSVLVPLRNEPHMVADLISALDRLDYPREKLEILILLEREDHATRDALARIRLPATVCVVMVPPGVPKTKPRALNAGLYLARGDLVTVYDAEDRPASDQLRCAASIFAQAPRKLACLQASLRIDRTDKRRLTGLFATEYATLFDLYNVGIARLRLPMALGGTSNHFRTDVLRAIGGWDAWNVTEDADLGIRLARFGYDTDILPSITFEEAPRSWTSWLKQRRRWTKGWMQTFIVLGKDRRVLSDLGLAKTLVVFLMMANLVIGPLLSPFFLVLVLTNFAWFGAPSPNNIIALGEATLSFSVILIGIASTLWCGARGLRNAGYSGDRSILLWLLPYQLMISAAAWGGYYDLLRNPYHWHKTDHGKPKGSP